MYRDPALQQLSRDHNLALSLVRDVRWARLAPEVWLHRRAAGELAAGWAAHMARHFDAEDRCLRPRLAGDELSRLDADHLRLRQLFDGLLATLADGEADPDQAAVLADEFYVHIRWEERSLYPELQARLSPEQLVQLAAELGDQNPPASPAA